MTDGLMFIFLVVIVIVGAVILFLIANGRRGGAMLDVERYRTSWMQINGQLVKSEESSYHLVILNADKLLDQALRQRGYKGNTMGERMKSARDIWSSRDGVWTAHKLRNQVAHEPDVRVSYDSARRALAAYKQALKDVGAI
jgi:hypothetical protein